MEAAAVSDPLALVRAKWIELSSLPAGKEEFSQLVGTLAPYTGSIGAVVTEFEHGYAEGCMSYGSKIANHLGSIHAMAIANFAEFIGNMALIASMPDGMRFIVTRFAIDYDSKARAVVEARATVKTYPKAGKTSICRIRVDLLDPCGESVGEATIYSQVGPNE